MQVDQIAGVMVEMYLGLERESKDGKCDSLRANVSPWKRM